MIFCGVFCYYKVSPIVIINDCNFFSLQCYMVGFLLFCCYNSNRRCGGDPETPSGSLASAPNSRRGLGLGSLTSCLLYDEIRQRNSDLPQSALAAQREQQLRQIKLEINELSHRLGIGQLYRGNCHS